MIITYVGVYGGDEVFIGGRLYKCNNLFLHEQYDLLQQFINACTDRTQEPVNEDDQKSKEDNRIFPR